MNLVEFAKKELAKLPSDPMQQMMNADIMRVITFFEEVANNHSGFSASYLLSMFTHLAERKELKVGMSDQEADIEEVKSLLTKVRRYYKRIMGRGHKEGFQVHEVIQDFRENIEKLWDPRYDKDLEDELKV